MGKGFASFFSKQDDGGAAQLHKWLLQYPFALLAVDTDGKITLANPAAEALLKASENALCQTPVSQWGLNYKQLRAAAAENPPRRFKVLLVTPQAEEVSASVAVTLHKESGYLLVALDPEEQQPHLAAQNRFLQAIVNSYPTAVSVQNLGGECVAWNAQAEKLFATPAKEALHRPVYQALPKALVSALQHLDKQMVQTRQDPADTSLAFTDQTGREVMLQITKKLVATGEPDEHPYILTSFRDVTAQHQAVQQSQQDRVLLQAILDNVPLGLYTRDGEGNIDFYNKQTLKILNEPDASSANTVHGNRPNTILLRDREILAEGKIREYPTEEYVDRFGHTKILHVIKVPLFNAGDKPIVLSIIEDVTERLKRDNEITHSHNLLKAILQNAPIGLYARTTKGNLILSNKQCDAIFGKKEMAVSRAPAADLPELPAIIQNYLSREQKLLDTGEILDIPEEEYITADGNRKILHMIKVPVNEEEKFVLTLVEDITERRKQEQEIKRINDLFTAIIDNVPIGLYARASNGNMLLRNKTCGEIFGQSAFAPMFDTQGRLPQETPEQIEGYVLRERQIIENGKIVDIPEETYDAENGERKLLHLIKIPVRGNPDFVLTVAEDITFKKAQQRKLESTTNFLQSVLDNVPVAIYARALNDKLVYVNHRADQMFPGETSETTSNEDFYTTREKHIFQEGKLVDIPEEWYTNLKGEKLLLHLIKTPVFDNEGNPIMVLTVAEDITKRKAQEQSIIESKNFLQAVINNLPVSLSVKDFTGKYILWNKKSEDLFGVTAGEVIGQMSYRADISKEQKDFLHESEQRVFEHKKEQDIPQELISTATEGVKIMHTVKTPVFNEDGTPNCLIVVSEDITAKTRMEKQIREASDKNSLLVENARECVIIVEDKRIIFANRAFCRMLGYDARQEFKNKPLEDFVTDDYKLFLREKLDSVIAGAENAGDAIHLHCLRKNGKEAEVEFAAVSSRYLGRRILLCFMRDITLSNRIQRELKNERESFRAAFENTAEPAFILSNNGYIISMNESCRKLFGFTDKDKNFYRNVYIKPAISLEVRKQLRKGEPAHMTYLLDFDRAQRLFPGRVTATGILELDVRFTPINKRDMEDGSVFADYVVCLKPKI